MVSGTIIETMTESEARAVVNQINGKAAEMGRLQSALNDHTVQPATDLTDRENAIRAAAFVDAEGCFSVQVQHNRSGREDYAILVSVTNTNEVLLKWLQAQYGGSVNRESSAKRAIYEPNAKPISRWFIKARMAETFIRQIAPYLLLKNEQARTLLEMREAMKLKISEQRYATLHSLKTRIHELNKRGLV